MMKRIIIYALAAACFASIFGCASAVPEIAEYEFEINAKTGAIMAYDTESIFD